MKRKISSVAAACFVAISMLFPAQAEEPKIKYEEEDGKIRVTIDDDMFTEFITTDTPKPYLYPIVGPTGAKMTRGFPMVTDNKDEEQDHPHHRSLWFAHGSIAGQDFWHSKKGSPTIESKASVSSIQGSLTGDKKVDCIVSDDKWFVKSKTEKPLLSSYTVIWVGVDKDKSRTIDYRTGLSASLGLLDINALAEELTFGDTKEGMMAMRLNPALRLKGKVATGKAINSNGDKDRNVWGKRAKWVAYWGEVDGKTCGVAIFDHPTNLRHPTWWHARDYGLVAANPFGMSDFERGKHKRGAGSYTVKKGEALDQQYRFIFFAGTAEEADIAGKYDQWVKETTPDKAEQE